MNAAVPLLSGSQWATFFGYAAALGGLFIIDPRIGSLVGVGVLIVLVIKNAGALHLGGQS